MTTKTAAVLPASTPARMERRARWMKRVNVPMRAVLRLPFPTPLSRRLMLVTLTGRKTGRVWKQPVSYVRDADTMLADTMLTPGGGRWKLNLRDGEPVPARVHGRHRQLRPELIRDPSEVERLLGVMYEHNQGLARFVPVLGSDGSIDHDALAAALAHGFCIVRWRS